MVCAEEGLCLRSTRPCARPQCRLRAGGFVPLAGCTDRDGPYDRRCATPTEPRLAGMRVYVAPTV